MSQITDSSLSDGRALPPPFTLPDIDLSQISLPAAVIETNWNVITGPPSCGKSAVIRELRRRGFLTQNEFAEDYLTQKLAEGIPPEEVKGDALRFEKLNVWGDVEILAKLNPDDKWFLDTSLIEDFVFARYYQIPIMDELPRFSAPWKFKNIFVLDPLPFHEKNGIRTEEAGDSAALRPLLISMYEDLGYTVIRVPFMGVEERADFILAHVTADL